MSPLAMTLLAQTEREFGEETYKRLTVLTGIDVVPMSSTAELKDYLSANVGATVVQKPILELYVHDVEWGYVEPSSMYEQCMSWSSKQYVGKWHTSISKEMLLVAITTPDIEIRRKVSGDYEFCTDRAIAGDAIDCYVVRNEEWKPCTFIRMLQTTVLIRLDDNVFECEKKHLRHPYPKRVVKLTSD
jgi:hypothetical protein